jgi:hypothetical protein
MAETCEAPKISKGILKTADRYLNKMRGGEKIMRDACGKLQWASGRPVGAKTVGYLMEEGKIVPLDTDLFGDLSRGQTIGIPS